MRLVEERFVVRGGVGRFIFFKYLEILGIVIIEIFFFIDR